MLAPGNAHVNGGLTYIDNYAIDSTAVDADPNLTGVTAEPDGSITIQWQSESNAAYQVRKNAAVADPFDPIATVTAAAPTAAYTDTNIVNNQGNYRVNLAP